MRKFGFAITSHGTVWHKLSMHHRIKKKNNSFLDIFYHTRGLGVLILVLVLSVSMIGIVKAECEPFPDCVSLGYTATSCEGRFVRCPFDITKLYCVPCDTIYKYTCSGLGQVGDGESCNGKYIECGCADGYEIEGDGCKRLCDVSYQYTCTGANITGGVGTSCGGLYTSCTCANLYSWTGSSCEHSHSYSCPSGYSSSNSGMITPGTTSKVCACGATSGTCYKETHSHSYNCPSGYSSSNSGMITPVTTSKVCSCGAKSGTCYKEGHSHSYSCPSGYSTSCSYGYWGTSSKKCSCGSTTGTCYSCKGYCDAYPCGSGCYTDISCTYGCASTNSCGGCESCKTDPCAGVTCPTDISSSCTYGCKTYSSATSCCSSVCTACKTHTHSYDCPEGYSTSCSETQYTDGSTAPKQCGCGATSGSCKRCIDYNTYSMTCVMGDGSYCNDWGLPNTCDGAFNECDNMSSDGIGVYLDFECADGYNTMFTCYYK